MTSFAIIRSFLIIVTSVAAFHIGKSMLGFFRKFYFIKILMTVGAFLSCRHMLLVRKIEFAVRCFKLLEFIIIVTKTALFIIFNIVTSFAIFLLRIQIVFRGNGSCRIRMAILAFYPGVDNVKLVIKFYQLAVIVNFIAGGFVKIISQPRLTVIFKKISRRREQDQHSEQEYQVILYDFHKNEF
jgi:hypothetical protein